MRNLLKSAMDPMSMEYNRQFQMPDISHTVNSTPATMLPKGLKVVLSKQRTGFWGQLGYGTAKPEFSKVDIPNCIYTFEPWLGCLWGTSCQFCYVPNLIAGFYPGGNESYWSKEWGHWLLPKYEITARLRRRLSDGFGRTRPSYKGAFIFMSAKTDPFLPIPDLLHITRNNLEVSLQADVFLMCQTRSGEVVENPEIFSLIAEMARYKKIGVSFSVSTDILEEQRMIEHGGLAPEHRLRTMARLKEAGVFVSAAVSPLMPYSVEFPQRLLDCAHHASIQLLRPSGFGSSTPKGLLNNVERVVPRYRELDRKLIEEINMLKQSNVFAWGVGNKGFIGAFLAAKQFYENR